MNEAQGGRIVARLQAAARLDPATPMAKITADADYTDEELLALARQNLATVLAGGIAKGIGGKSLTYASLPQIRAEISLLERRIAARNGGTIVHSRHRRR
jgi:hypothetical protein